MQENGDQVAKQKALQTGAGRRRPGGGYSVCLCKIEEEEIRELRCGNMFHNDCLETWVGHRNGACPFAVCLAPPRTVNEVGEESIAFKYCAFSSRDCTMWWLH